MINNIITWLFQKDNEKVIKEWKKKFPRKCIICSYHKFGYEHGMTLDPNPPKHDCSYKKKKKTEKRT